MNEHGWKNRDYQNVERGEAYPESLTRQNSPNTQLAQAKWTSTVTNKLLLEAGWSFNHFDQSNLWPEGLPVPTTENPFLAVRRVDLRGTPDIVANLPYGAPQLMQSGPSLKHWYTSTLTYITGTHALKGGFQFQKGFARTTNAVPPSPELGANMMQRYLSGVPNSVVLYNLPRQSRNDMVADLGLFVQDTWTRGRLTLNPGLRYDYFHGRVPAQIGWGWPLGAGAHVRRRGQRAVVARRHAAAGRGVRPLRQRQDRHQGQHGDVPLEVVYRHRRPLQPDAGRHRYARLDRLGTATTSRIRTSSARRRT